MTEASRFWNTNNEGDGASSGYTPAQIASWMKAVFGEGILIGIGSELAVSGSASPLSVADGAALVDGLFYENNAAVELTVTTPSVGITGGRVILRADWTAQTVRAAVLLNTDGVADIPDLTQTSRTTYEICLATFQIETDGDIISLTIETERASFGGTNPQIVLNSLGVLGNPTNSEDVAEMISPVDGLSLVRNGTSLEFGQLTSNGIADDAVDTDQIADDAVDDVKLGSRVPKFTDRQGGDATDWNSPGASNYTPGNIRAYAGATEVLITSWYTTNVYNNDYLVTLPGSLSKPIIFTAFLSIATTPPESPVQVYSVIAEALDNNHIGIHAYRAVGSSSYATIRIAWLAIGPEA